MHYHSGKITKQLEVLEALDHLDLTIQEKAWTQLDNNGYNILMAAAIQPNKKYLETLLKKTRQLDPEIQTKLWSHQNKTGHTALALIILEHPNFLSKALEGRTEFNDMPIDKLLPIIATSTLDEANIDVMLKNINQAQIEQILECRLPLKMVLPIFKRIQQSDDKNAKAIATSKLLNKLVKAHAEPGIKAITAVFDHLTKNKYPNASDDDKRNYLNLEMTLCNQQVMPKKGSGLFDIFRKKTGTKTNLRQEQQEILDQYQSTKKPVR